MERALLEFCKLSIQTNGFTSRSGSCQLRFNGCRIAICLLTSVWSCLVSTLSLDGDDDDSYAEILCALASLEGMANLLLLWIHQKFTTGNRLTAQNCTSSEYR